VILVYSKKNKRKGINSSVIFGLALSILAFVVMGIIVSIGGSIIAGVNATQTNANAIAVANNATAGLGNVGAQLPLMGTILVFGAVIALLLAVFWFRGKGGM
jgi:hypothetical protein